MHNKKPHLIIMGLFILLLGLLLCSILQGPVTIPTAHILHILKQAILQHPLSDAVPPWQQSIILDVRLPKTLIAFFCRRKSCIMRPRHARHVSKSTRLTFGIGRILGRLIRRSARHLFRLVTL